MDDRSLCIVFKELARIEERPVEGGVEHPHVVEVVHLVIIDPDFGEVIVPDLFPAFADLR